MVKRAAPTHAGECNMHTARAPVRPCADSLMDGDRHAHDVGTEPWANASCVLIYNWLRVLLIDITS